MPSSFGNAPGMHLQDLILDTKSTATAQQKADCLKLLRVVVKNLSDPTKAQDPKYRQLRLSNDKVRTKLLPCPSAVEYMKAIGFVECKDDDGSEFLRIEMTKDVNVVDMAAAVTELTNALEMVSPSSSSSSSSSSGAAQKRPPPPRRSSSSFVEEKKTPEGILKPAMTSSSTSYPSTGKLSEKQKARQLLERKRQREAEEAKAERAKNVAMLKQDKYVRENDENWTAGVSAAREKSGDGMMTFRDRHGE